jgi:hypothetical protein
MNKFKEKLRKFWIVATMLALLGGSVVAIAQTENPAKDALVQSLAEHLQKNPDNQLAILLAQFLLADSGKEPSLGALSTQPNKIIGENLVLKDSDSQIHIGVGWEEIDFPTATTTVFERNVSGQQIIIDYAEIEVNGTVSSTFNMSVGVVSSTAANTRRFVPFDAAATNRPSNLIDGTQFVTSTAIVQNPSTVYRFLRNSEEDQGTEGLSSVVMTTSSYIVWFAQGTNNVLANNDAGEQVTSTNRGWTARLRYRYHYRLPL